MVWAFGRLFVILAATIITAVLVVISMRAVGLQQRYSAFTAELRGHPNMTLVDVDSLAEESPIFTPENADKIILMLKVRFHPDKSWYIESTRGELRDSDPAQVVADNPDFFFYLDIFYPNMRELDPLLKSLSELPNANRLILSSPRLDTLRAIRNYPGPWLSGHSTSEIGKQSLLANMFLEPVMDASGDVFVVQRPNERLVKELLRRKLFVFQEAPTEAEQSIIRSQHPEIMFLIRRSK